MARSIISTEKAPQAIGTYSQAVKIEKTVYISGQIPLVPETMELVEGDMRTQGDLGTHITFNKLHCLGYERDLS